MRDRRVLIVAALSIGLLILALYGRTLAYGLVWDDFAALRPRSLSALLAAWTGPWDPGGVWPEFYRPASMALYASMYQLFGHHAMALHAANLAELFLASWMLRAFVRRETQSARLGLLAALLLILHPETPSSLAAWISQQFQLAALVVVLGTLLLWQRVRHDRGASWGWLLLPLTVGILFKEDVVMVAPALLAWQWIRARVVGDVPSPSRGACWIVAGWIAVYLAWRTIAIGGIGGYGWPAPDRLLLNVINGPVFAFAMQWIPSAHLVSVVIGAGLAVVAVLAWRQRRDARPPLKALALYGVALGLCANVPLVLVSGHTRLYLMILAATLTLTAALGIIAERLVAGRSTLPRQTTDVMRNVIVAALTIWLAAVGFANWTHTDTFAPCAPETRQRNTEALSWDIVGADVRADIDAQLAACDTRGATP